MAASPTTGLSAPTSLDNVLSLAQSLNGTTTTQSSTTSSNLTEDDVTTMVNKILASNQGLAAVTSGQKASGAYDSTANALLSGNLVAQTAADASLAAANKTTTTQTNTPAKASASQIAALTAGGYILDAAGQWIKSAGGISNILGGGGAAGSVANVGNDILGGSSNALANSTPLTGDLSGTMPQDIADAIANGTYDPATGLINSGTLDPVTGLLPTVGDYGSFTGAIGDISSSVGDFAGAIGDGFAADGIDYTAGALGADAAAGFAADAGATYAAGALGADAAASFGAEAVGAGIADAAATDGLAEAAAAIIAWIVCTELYKQGRMPARFYVFGSKVFAKYPVDKIGGYYIWAVPLVKHLRVKPNSLISKCTEIIFNARAEYLAAISGYKYARKTIGGFITTHGLYAFCWILGSTVAKNYSSPEVSVFKSIQEAR